MWKPVNFGSGVFPLFAVYQCFPYYGISNPFSGMGTGAVLAHSLRVGRDAVTVPRNPSGHKRRLDWETDRIMYRGVSLSESL